MVAIAPLRALRFDPARVTMPLATSPPHDCITSDEREALAAACEASIVRVVLPKQEDGDLTDGDRFTRAADVLAKWRADGTMVRDASSAYYLYEITSGPPEDRRNVRSLVARLALDPTYKEVLPHEAILRGPKRDRLRLREATQTDTEPIWLLYRDERGWVDEILTSNAFEEATRFMAPDGTEHRLWRVDRAPAVAEVTAQFDDRTLVIADGHHRYQTALDHAEATGDPRHASILVALVRDNDPGLAIEATHRVVLRLPFGPDEALRRASTLWQVLPVPADAGARLAAALNPDGRDMVLALPGQAAAGGGLQTYLLTLPRASEAPAGRGRIDRLAVTRLHERLLRDAWGIDIERPEETLRFTRDADAALARVASGEAAAAVLIAPESVASVLEVAKEGHKMPQKATYFVPKLRSGVVLGPLDEPVPRRWSDGNAPVA